MAKKKEIVDENIEEIKKHLKSGKIITGTKETLKELKMGNISQIFLAKNCPDVVKRDILNYSKLNKTKVMQLNSSNEELGFICKKRYSVCVLSIPKGAN